MGRSPCCDADANVKKGPWTQEEDDKLMEYIEKNGCGNWKRLPKLAGLNRCGKSCRLRWTNYLRPDIKRGKFSEEEERLIIYLHSVLGNKWSAIATRLKGRTDNEIKNYWNTHLRKKLLTMGVDPVTHRPRINLNLLATLPNLITAASNINNLATNPLINNALQLQKLQLFQTIIEVMASSSNPNLTIEPMAQLGLPSSFLDGSINPLVGLNLSDPSFQHLRNDVVTPLVPNYGSSSYVFDVKNTSVMNTPANSTPCSVSISPEISTVDQEQGPVKTKIDASASSSPTSTPPPFNQGWTTGLTLDDLDIDLGWKDIFDQISWSDSL